MDMPVGPIEGVTDAGQLAESIRSHADTSDEIVALCKDLQVLGRSDFKALLRWCVSHCKHLACCEAAICHLLLRCMHECCVSGLLLLLAFWMS